MLLTQKLLPVIRQICVEFFIFQQGNVPAHRARGTINFLKRDTRVHFTRPFTTQQHRSELNWLQKCGRNAAAGLASSCRRWTEAALASFQAAIYAQPDPYMAFSSKLALAYDTAYSYIEFISLPFTSVEMAPTNIKFGPVQEIHRKTKCIRWARQFPDPLLLLSQAHYLKRLSVFSSVCLLAHVALLVKFMNIKQMLLC